MQKPRIVTFWSRIRSKYSLPHKYKDSCLTLFLVISLLVTKYSYFSPLFVCRFNYSLSFIFWPWQGWWALRKMRLKKDLSLTAFIPCGECFNSAFSAAGATTAKKLSLFSRWRANSRSNKTETTTHAPTKLSTFFSKQPNRDTWKIEIIKKENLEKTEPLEHLNESKIEAVGSSRALNWACQPGHLDFTHVFLLFLSSGNFLELRFFRCWLTFCGYMEPKGTKAKCW